MIRATLRRRSFSQKTAVLRDVSAVTLRRARSRLARLSMSGDFYDESPEASGAMRAG